MSSVNQFRTWLRRAPVRRWHYSRPQLFLSGFRTMYYACRVDYPCEGCEQPRWMAFKNALGWAWRYR